MWGKLDFPAIGNDNAQAAIEPAATEAFHAATSRPNTAPAARTRCQGYTTTMPEVASRLPHSARGPQWKWWICGLLFLATVINYMDRQTLSQTAKNIKDELRLKNEEYGYLEFGFGTAFALGALAVGWTADRWNVRWIYPAALLGWSAAGFLTGLATTFWVLFACRFALGLCEAGNWPCALRTTQRILAPAERTMGNGILQSGAAIGAILTPLIVELLVVGPGTWNRPFLVIGAAGTFWVFIWLASVRSEDLALARPEVVLRSSSPGSLEAKDSADSSLAHIYRDQRFWVCVLLVVVINQTWHFFRVWLPLFLIEGHGYSQREANFFTMAYYVATDLGSLAAGFATLYLARRGLKVHTSRLLVFLACALLTTLSLAVARLPDGWPLRGLILLLGFGALGLYPMYYSWSQELTVRHQGKITGTLGCITWLFSAVTHPLVGRWLDQTKNYSPVVALAGLLPMAGFLGLIFFWRSPALAGQQEKE
jgi:ACS family hexuronate transporter-like MFS transporter